VVAGSGASVMQLFFVALCWRAAVSGQLEGVEEVVFSSLENDGTVCHDVIEWWHAGPGHVGHWLVWAPKDWRCSRMLTSMSLMW